jgi:hypothetical protein
MRTYKLKDAARTLDMDVLELVRRANEQGIETVRVDGRTHISEFGMDVFQERIIPDPDDDTEWIPAEGYSWVNPEKRDDYGIQLKLELESEPTPQPAETGPITLDPSLLIPVIEEISVSAEPEPYSPPKQLAVETPDDFTLRMIHELRSGDQRGIHTRHTGFNSLFRDAFPELDPVTETKRMAHEGLIRILPRRGGVIMFDEAEPWDGRRRSRSRVEAVTSYDYTSKNQWRERWMEFVRENVFVGRETRVLTLVGPEALEIPGYDKLGIKRKNIVGIEQDHARADKVRGKGLGIKVVEADVYDFLQETDFKFDVVLLDYDGKISEDKVRTLELLVQRQLLTEQAVMGINLFGNREAIEQQLLYLEPYFGEESLETLARAGIKTDKVPAPALETTRNLNGIRDYGITAITLKMLMGKDAVQTNRTLLNMLPRAKKKNWEAYIKGNPPQGYMDFLKLNEQLRSELEQTLGDGREAQRGEVHKLAFVAGVASSKPYFVTAMDRTRYTTESGNNTFFSDFYAVDQRTRLFDCLGQPYLRKFLGGRQAQKNFLHQLGKLPKNKRGAFLRDIRQAYNSVAAAYQNFFVSDEIPARVNLTTGSGVDYCSGTSEDVGIQVRDLLDVGMSDDDILDALPDLERKSLPGYKAARTRDLQGVRS